LEPTHQVFNQTPLLTNFSFWTVDPLLQGLALPEEAKQRLQSFGERLGREEMLLAGRLANEIPPTLNTHDRYGNRSDTVDFHPSYHHLMTTGMQFGIHCLPWTKEEPDVASHLERAAGHYLLSQVEAGVGCPLTMTFSGIPALRKYAPAELQETWLPKLCARQ